MRDSPRFGVLFPSPERQRAGQLAMIFSVEFVKVGAVANLLRMPVNIARKAFRKKIFCQKRQESYFVGTYGRGSETENPPEPRALASGSADVVFHGFENLRRKTRPRL